MVSILIAFRRHTEQPFLKMSKDDLYKAIHALQTSDESDTVGRSSRKRWQQIPYGNSLKFEINLLWLSDQKKTKLKREEILNIALPGCNKKYLPRS